MVMDRVPVGSKSRGPVYNHLSDGGGNNIELRTSPSLYAPYKDNTTGSDIGLLNGHENHPSARFRSSTTSPHLALQQAPSLEPSSHSAEKKEFVEEPEETRSSNSRHKGSWWPEIISWIISFLCMVAVVVVLLRYNKGPLPEWWFGMTLNTFLTIMSITATTVLAVPLANGISQLKWIHFYERKAPIVDMQIYDDASRGFWGSLYFLKAMCFDHLHGG